LLDKKQFALIINAALGTYSNIK